MARRVRSGCNVGTFKRKNGVIRKEAEKRGQ